MALIDPDKQSAEEAENIARRMKEAGTDAVLIGGSTGVTSQNLSETAIAVRKAGLMSIHFPGGPTELSTDVDALLFMTMVNSTRVDMITGMQAYAAPFIKKVGIDAIPMGYIIIEPGMKVGEVGKADAIKRDDIPRAVGYAMACEMLGMQMVYLEAGSGAPEHVPNEMIAAVKGSISIPLIVGGGIRTPEAAAEVRAAGADIIITGTLLEQCQDDSTLRAVVAAAKGAQ